MKFTTNMTSLKRGRKFTKQYQSLYSLFFNDEEASLTHILPVKLEKALSSLNLTANVFREGIVVSITRLNYILLLRTRIVDQYIF